MDAIDGLAPNERSALFAGALLWGVAVAITLYNIAADLIQMRREKNARKRKRAPERRFVEPCAPDRHTLADGACTTCGAEGLTPVLDQEPDAESNP